VTAITFWVVKSPKGRVVGIGRTRQEAWTSALNNPLFDEKGQIARREGYLLCEWLEKIESYKALHMTDCGWSEIIHKPRGRR